MNEQLAKRLARWEAKWTIAYARWAWVVRKHECYYPQDATPQMIDLMAQEEYCFEKWMGILVDAGQQGVIDQDQIDAIIYRTYPLLIKNVDELIRKHNHDAA